MFQSTETWQVFHALSAGILWLGKSDFLDQASRNAALGARKSWTSANGPPALLSAKSPMTYIQRKGEKTSHIYGYEIDAGQIIFE